MTLQVNDVWKIHTTCLREFANLEFSLFYQIWYSLEKQKVGFVLLAGKNAFFPDTQNMESKSDTWINFCIKVRFLGLWKMSFFGNLMKIFTICTIGKTNIFDSVENFIRLPWQKFALFWLLSFVHSLWENERSRLIYKSMIQIDFSKISFSRRYSSCWYLLYVTKKGSGAHVLGGRTVCGILQKLWISCSIWLR